MDYIGRESNLQFPNRVQIARSCRLPKQLEQLMWQLKQVVTLSSCRTLGTQASNDNRFCFSTDIGMLGRGIAHPSDSPVVVTLSDRKCNLKLFFVTMLCHIVWWLLDRAEMSC